MYIYGSYSPHPSTQHAQIESELKALLAEMVGPPDGGDKKQSKRPHVKVMILNSGNMPMFLNMMCSARRGVRRIRFVCARYINPIHPIHICVHIDLPQPINHPSHINRTWTSKATSSSSRRTRA